MAMPHLIGRMLARFWSEKWSHSKAKHSPAVFFSKVQSDRHSGIQWKALGLQANG